MFLNKILLPVDTNLNISIDSPVRNYILEGGRTLTDNVTLNVTGTVPEGTSYVFFYNGVGTVLDGHSLTILDFDMFSLFNQNVRIEAFYIDAEWKLYVSSLLSIPDASITLDKLSENSRLYSLPVRIDLTATLKDQAVRIRIPHSFSVTQFYYNVIETINNADDASFIVNSAGTDIHTLVLPGGTVSGTASSVTPIQYQTSNANWLTITPSKITAGGIVLFSFTIRKCECGPS